MKLLELIYIFGVEFVKENQLQTFLKSLSTK